MNLTKTPFTILVSALIAGLGAAPAIGGEITGNGKDIDVNGRSICAFSGQNDGNLPPGRTQSFGTSVSNDWRDPKALDRDYVSSGPGDINPHPGWACDPHHIDLHAGS